MFSMSAVIYKPLFTNSTIIDIIIAIKLCNLTRTSQKIKIKSKITGLLPNFSLMLKCKKFELERVVTGKTFITIK